MSVSLRKSLLFLGVVAVALSGFIQKVEAQGMPQSQTSATHAGGAMPTVIPPSLPTTSPHASTVPSNMESVSTSQRAVGVGDYTVRDVKVDITAKSAYEARAQAITKAGEEAFQMLLATLVSPADGSRLSNGGPHNAEDYIETFEVSGEKFSSTRYLATFSVSFKPSKVKSLLAKYDLTPVLQSSSAPLGDPQDTKPALILPVFVTEGDVLLWEERSPWFQHWSTQDGDDTSVIVPVGDLNDVRDLSAEAAQAGAVDSIGRLLGRYTLDQAVVAVVDVTRAGVPKLELFQYSKEGLLRKSGPVDLGTSSDLKATLRQAEQKTRLLLKDFAGSFQAAATLQEVSLGVRFSSLKEWHFIREKLELLPMVKEISVQSLRKTGATLRMKVVGSPEGALSLLKGGDLQVGESPSTGDLIVQRDPAKAGAPLNASVFPGAPSPSSDLIGPVIPMSPLGARDASADAIEMHPSETPENGVPDSRAGGTDLGAADLSGGGV